MATRKLTGERLVIASHNAGKVREINDLVAPYGFAAAAAGDLGLEDPEETGASYEANALLKARTAAKGANLPALSDDSGLSVDALGGAPGIYSARWAETGAGRDFAAAMARLERALRGAPTRRARFVCVLALAWPDGEEACFRGEVAGEIVFPPRGSRGFGYDPVFVPDGGRETFGEIDPAAKHAISHRARAFAQFVDACLKT